MTTKPFFHVSEDYKKVVINNDSFPTTNHDEIKILISEVMSDKFNLDNTDKNTLLTHLRELIK